MYLSAFHASKIWRLYGFRGLESPDQPPENTVCGDGVRYHVKTGGHSMTLWDWEQYFDTADKVFNHHREE